MPERRIPIERSEHRLRVRGGPHGRRTNEREPDDDLLWLPVRGMRAVDEGEEGLVEGYAYRFDDTYDAGLFTESIAPGAATGSIEADDSDVRILLGHDSRGLVYARQSNRTLRLAEDKAGLAFGFRLDLRSAAAASLYYAIERGDMDGMSVGFWPIEERKTVDPEGEEPPHYDVLRMDLVEVSVVAWPAYRSSSVGVGRAAGLDRLGRRLRFLRGRAAGIPLRGGG